MRWLHRVTLLLGVLLLGILLWKLGPAALFSQLRLLGWIWIPLLLVEGLGEAVHVNAWRHCLSREQQRIPWLRIAMIRQAGMAFNYLTPTAHMGGEFVKGAILGRNGGSVEAATAVIVGKLALVFAQLSFVSMGSLVSLWLVKLPAGFVVGWGASTALFATGILAFFLLQRKGKLGSVIRAVQRVGLGGHLTRSLSDWLTEVDGQLEAFHRSRPGDLVRAMFWHSLGFACGLSQAWLFLAWMGEQSPWQTGAAIWFLGAWFDLVGFIVPAGIGVQEGSRVLIFDTLGLASLAGLTFGVALRVSKAFWALIGLLCYGVLLRETKGRTVF
jgi:glycosyltransferase 2 family protein